MADRDSFVTSRRRDYFSEKELTQRLGFPKNQWALVLAKELIDNALDHLDSEIAPEITVTLTANSLSVEDNGSGLPEETIVSSLNYDERVSTKYHYVGPTRGQLGNALMCVYAAPFVYAGAAHNGSDRVDIETVEQQSHGAFTINHGIRYEITVNPDNLEQDPSLPYIKKPSKRKVGTAVKIYWKGIAESETEYGRYKHTVASALPELIRDFAALNPHASFKLKCLTENFEYKPIDPLWTKWYSKDNAGSPHWYDTAAMQDLIQTRLRNKKDRGTRLLLRDFIGTFYGLHGSRYQAAVISRSRLTVSYLDELPVDKIENLLDAMKIAKQVQPKKLGFLGEQNILLGTMARHDVFEDERYKIETGVRDGMPFVIEAAFGVKDSEDDHSVVIVPEPVTRPRYTKPDWDRSPRIQSHEQRSGCSHRQHRISKVRFCGVW